MLHIAIIATWVLLDITQSLLVSYELQRGFDLETYLKGLIFFGTSMPLVGLLCFSGLFEKRFWNCTTTLLACVTVVLFIVLILLLIATTYIPIS